MASPETGYNSLFNSSEKDIAWMIERRNGLNGVGYIELLRKNRSFRLLWLGQVGERAWRLV